MKKNYSKVIFVLLVFCVICFGSSWVTAESTYTITDLGTLGIQIQELPPFDGWPGECHPLCRLSGNYTESSIAYGMNNKGQVVGANRVEIEVVDDSGAKFGTIYKYYPFLWTKKDGISNLGSLGGDCGIARGINDKGHVVGDSSLVKNSYSYFAFLWSKEKGMVSLGGPGSKGSSALSINNSDHVVGWSYVDGTYHAFLWTKQEGMVDLGTLESLPPFPPPYTSTAFDINNRGQVVGRGTIGAFFWTSKGGMKALITPDGWTNSSADAINDAGQVVVNSFAGNAFLWTEQGGMVDLGTMGNYHIRVSDINNRGDFVGRLSWFDYSSAFVFADGEFHELKDYLPYNSGWELREAIAINDQGQICGTGYINNEEHAFLLTPVP